MIRALALLPLLLAASCASDWRFVAAKGHPALREGVELATFEQGHGAEYERRVDIRDGAQDVPIESVDTLLPFVRPLDTADAAIAYSDLVREIDVPGSGARGLAVRPDPTLTGPGGNGRYSRLDAAGWGIPFGPTTRMFGGGLEVSRVILFAPIPHPVLARADTPWRLVLTREVVMPDGHIKPVEDKTLTNGQDAARFADR